MILYVRTQGSRIVKEGQHLLVKKELDTYHTLFVHKLRQLVLFGNVAMSPSARRTLLRQGVDTVFLTADGRYLGRFELPEAKNIFLRRKQFERIGDADFGLRFCRQVVAGKLTNAMTMLMRINRTKTSKEPGERAKDIRNLVDQVKTANNLDTLRGYEGRGAALYFGALRHGFSLDMGFRRRVRRPPTDPVNAVLSLLYTFLLNRVYAAVRIAHLDPYLGYLHTLDYGRHSLVMDLMEEFRVIIADTLTLALFNLKILEADDFEPAANEEAPAGTEDEENDSAVLGDFYSLAEPPDNAELFDVPPQRMEDAVSVQEDGRGKPGLFLKSEPFKKVIANFERKLTTEFFYEPHNRKITYEEAIVAQAGQYRRLIEGEIHEYQPLLLK